LKKSRRLTKILQEEHEVMPAEDLKLKERTEEHIIHEAVGILHRKIAAIEPLENEYYSSQEMELDSQVKFVDPLLYKTILWLTNKSVYESGGDTVDHAHDIGSLSVAADIIYLSRSIVTPKHLGLTNLLHHQYGSRKLIDDLHAHGYCISYDEYRRFHTSAALYTIALQPKHENGSFPYVPPEIIQEGNLIIGVADNWDHNERTVDGARTTHAMTSILVQRQHPDRERSSARIPRYTDRALSTDSGICFFCMIQFLFFFDLLLI